MQGQSQQTEATGTEGESPLTISPEKVCFIIMKAREFDAGKFPLYQGRIKRLVRYLGRVERHRLGLDRSELSFEVSDRSIKRH